MYEIITHLNDDHCWTRDKIGAWVAEIEPADARPTEDIAEAAWREDEGVGDEQRTRWSGLM